MTWRCIESDPPGIMQLLWLAGSGARRHTPTEWHLPEWKTHCMIKGYTHWSPCEPPEDPPPNRPLETYANWNKWIKCEEREHPDLIMDESGEFAESKHVLVSIWERSHLAVSFFREEYDKDGCWKRTWVDPLSGTDFDLRCHVTHWQPLPKAPNEN